MRPLFKGMSFTSATAKTVKTAKIAILAAALTAGSAQAHQTNPQCYVDGVQIQPVGKFAFTSKQVADFHAELMRRPPGSCPAGGGAGGVSAKSCGQVDHWHVARIMSAEYCAQLQGGAEDGGKASGPVPVAEVTAPPSYLSPEHHSRYTYKAANPGTVVLQGLCVICYTVEAPPQK
ncbi:hypothetical protein ACI2IY_19670 [Lysobacter enzymogenes]|uniref:hypothetical protein n=1 Tax=Lysobacter enzymogenes TaxID=69 RepID=UPI00384F99AA